MGTRGSMVEGVPTETRSAEHMADRSSWDCRFCGHPWPCAPAKVALIEEYDAWPSPLTMFLVATFFEAQASYADREEPPDLFERIVLWALIKRTRRAEHD